MYVDTHALAISHSIKKIIYTVVRIIIYGRVILMYHSISDG
jgi:hypothetical protein